MNTPYDSPTDPAFDWREDANCRNVDPDRMQPEWASPADIDRAQRICLGCPVIDQCAAVAADHAAYGVWAGAWHGDPPKDPGSCEWCGATLGRTRRARFCGASCRVAAHKANRVRELSA